MKKFILGIALVGLCGCQPKLGIDDIERAPSPDVSKDVDCNMIPDAAFEPGTVWQYAGARKKLLPPAVRVELRPEITKISDFQAESKLRIGLGTFLKNSFSAQFDDTSSGTGLGYATDIKRSFKDAYRYYVTENSPEVEAADKLRSWPGLNRSAEYYFIGDVIKAKQVEYTSNNFGGAGVDINKAVEIINSKSVAAKIVSGNSITIGPQTFTDPQVVCIQAYKLSVNSDASAMGGVVITVKKLSRDEMDEFVLAQIES